MRRKVLILRLSSLGDIVHASAALPVLREAGVEISWLVKPGFADLLTATAPDVRISRFETDWGEARAKEKLFAWAASEQFDAILDLHDSLRTRLWRKRLGGLAPVFVAKKPRWREFLVLFLRQRSLGLGYGGRARRMRAAACDLVRALGWGEPLLEGAVSLTSLTPPQLEAHWRERLPSGPYYVLLPGSAWETKRWPERAFAELAENLARERPVIVLGGAHEDFCARIAARAQAVNSLSCDLHGKTSLGQSAAILAGAALVIGNDTGLLHLAEAFGKSVVAIEGPTSPALGYSAYRRDSEVVGLDLLCRPCSKNGRFCWRLGTHACLNKLSVAEVMRGIARVNGGGSI